MDASALSDQEFGDLCDALVHDTHLNGQLVNVSETETEATHPGFKCSVTKTSTCTEQTQRTCLQLRQRRKSDNVVIRRWCQTQ